MARPRPRPRAAAVGIAVITGSALVLSAGVLSPLLAVPLVLAIAVSVLAAWSALRDRP